MCRISRSVFNPLRNCLTVFYSGFSTLHSYYEGFNFSTSSPELIWLFLLLPSQWVWSGTSLWFWFGPSGLMPLTLQAVLTGAESRVTQGVHGGGMRLTWGDAGTESASCLKPQWDEHRDGAWVDTFMYLRSSEKKGIISVSEGSWGWLSLTWCLGDGRAWMKRGSQRAFWAEKQCDQVPGCGHKHGKGQWAERALSAGDVGNKKSWVGRCQVPSWQARCNKETKGHLTYAREQFGSASL